MKHAAEKTKGRPSAVIAPEPALWVLLAEDNAELLGVLAHTLRREGYEVAEAASGTALLQQITTSVFSMRPTRQFDAIITDIWMPGFSGIDLLSGLRDAQWDATMILMSGDPSPAMRDEAMALGADAYFHKPFDVEDLLAALHRAKTAGHHRSPEALARHAR